MKSSPKSSKLYYLNSGLSLLPTDYIKSVANLFIFYKVFLKLKFAYLWSKFKYKFTLFKIFLKLLIRNFITTLEFPIIITFFLYSIISQMNKFILNIFQCKLFTCCTYISLFIPISFHNSIYCGNKYITSHIKLSFIIKKWIFHIFLN